MPAMVLPRSRARPVLGISLAMLVGACTPVAGPSGGARPPAPSPSQLQGTQPRLVVLVVVDQMRSDYIERFGDLFASEPGGLRWLSQEGVSFRQAVVAHAPTKTAPGHASIVTGTHPSAHGVPLNHWYEGAAGASHEAHAGEDPEVTVVGGDPSTATTGFSPSQLKRPTVGDWLKRQQPESRVYALAAKSRAAIMLGGHHPDGVWWYDSKRAAYVTSTHYTKVLPAWVDAFNRSGAIDQFFTTGWPRVASLDAYARMGPDAVAHEMYGFSSVLPYTFDEGNPGDLAAYHKRLKITPFSDVLTFDLAKRTITAAGLGLDEVPDLLLVGASAGDMIGHGFGPDSHEMLDYYLRLDRELIGLYQHLVNTRNPDEFVLVLTSDHGVSSLPEHLREAGEADARRILTEDFERDIEEAIAGVADTLGLTPGVLRHIGTHGVWLNHELAGAKGVAADALNTEVARALRELPYVADALTSEELAGRQPRAEARPWMAEYRRGYYPGRSPDVVLRIEPNVLAPTLLSGTSHGSPYGHDTHVPWLVGGAGIGHRVVEQPVQTVDVAPTLADLLGIAPAAGVHGTSAISLILHGDPGLQPPTP